MADQNNTTIFFDLNLYIQKAANLYTKELDILELEYDVVPRLIEELTNNVLQVPSEETLKLIEIAIDEIEELQNKGSQLFDKVQLISTEIDQPQLIDPSRETYYLNEFHKKYTIEFYILRGNLVSLRERLMKRLGKLITKSVEAEFEDNNLPRVPKYLQVNLDRYQIPLLYSYLKERKLIINHSDVILCKILNQLTGHSAKTMSQYGFSALEAVKRDNMVNKVTKPKGAKFYNLNRIKEELIAIIKLIDNDIERLEKLSSEKSNPL